MKQVKLREMFCKSRKEQNFHLFFTPKSALMDAIFRVNQSSNAKKKPLTSSYFLFLFLTSIAGNKNVKKKPTWPRTRNLVI